VPGSTFQCWLDGKLEPCSSPKGYTNLGYGDHFFAVLATNPAGVVESEWVEYEWTILPPIARLDSVPADTTDSSTARFEFSSPDPDAKFQCSLDGRAFVSCASPKVYEQLWPGIHRFEVQAVYPNMAQLGLTPVPVSHQWTIVDNEPPDTYIEFGPPNNTASTDAFIGFGTEDPTAIIECSLDGEPFSECEPPLAEYTGLAVGKHTLRVQAIDPAETSTRRRRATRGRSSSPALPRGRSALAPTPTAGSTRRTAARTSAATRSSR
jgi:large repetitive protein